MISRTGICKGELISSLDLLVNRALSDPLPGKKRDLREMFWYKNAFLPSHITNYNSEQEDCFAYILRHTQRRPRELIWVINQIIRKAYEKNELPLISERSVVDGLHDRRTLTDILRDSLSPYQEYIDDIADRARSVFWGKPRVMSGSELKKFAKSFYDVKPIKDTTDIDPETFVNYLMRSGLIGQIINIEGCGTSKSGYCKANFEYLMQDHIPLNNQLMYYVHPLMGDFFNMTRVPGYGAVYPVPVDDTWLEERLLL